MPRNQEVIRQWKLLHVLESARHGVTLNALSTELNVTTRTIRRDLAALQEAGFPLYDLRNDDGRALWHIEGQALSGLQTGFTLGELCALYLSRKLLETIGGSPFQRDLKNAFGRLERELSPRMRNFLDRLPVVLATKPGPKDPGSHVEGVTAQLLEATLHFRCVTMQYNSVSSGRIKNYVIHPYRLVFAQGGLYLLAFVPAYKDMRTFAVSRIQGVSLAKETFTPSKEIQDDVFANSLGVNTGEAKQVKLEFFEHVAPYVRARVWHSSQEISDSSNGSLLMTMHVCHDWALRSWILGWGPYVKVLAPNKLSKIIKADLASMTSLYHSPSN